MADDVRATAQILEAFRTDGLVKVPTVIGDVELSELKAHFWSEIEEQFDIREHDTDSWFVNPFNPSGGSQARRLSGMNPVMDRLRTAGRLRAAEAAIQELLDATFGSDRWTPLHKWYSLLNFPGTEEVWTVPHTSWHNDEPIVVGDHEPWSIFAFVFLDDVEVDTGPTAAITGTHRRGEVLAEQKAITSEREVGAFSHVNSDIITDPSQVKLLPVGDLLDDLVATDDWFRGLVEKRPDEDRVEKYMTSGTSEMGISSRVVPLAAQAGDVILFDPRCLHSYSSNVSSQPRQVLRIDFRRTTP